MRQLRVHLSITALAAALSMAVPMTAQASIWLQTGPETSRPYGHVEYCAKYGRDCRALEARGSLPAARLALLQKVNRAVNRAITPVSDIKQFGKREFWSPSTKAGDCEDFALAKRTRLLRQGFHPSNLLLTMTKWKGVPHTVLVVRTREGDFVLDNTRDEVLPVQATGLSYVKMQSAANSARWLRITGKTGQLR